MQHARVPVLIKLKTTLLALFFNFIVNYAAHSMITIDLGSCDDPLAGISSINLLLYSYLISLYNAPICAAIFKKDINE